MPGMCRPASSLPTGWFHLAGPAPECDRPLLETRRLGDRRAGDCLDRELDTQRLVVGDPPGHLGLAQVGERVGNEVERAAVVAVAERLQPGSPCWCGGQTQAIWS